MRLGRLYLALLLISGGQAQAQDVAANWFPVHVGDTWLYEHETRDETGEGRDHLEIHSWKTEETIFGSWTIPEGTLVGRQVRVIEGSLRKGYRVDSDPAYLIRRDCLYRLRGVDWEPAARQLTPDFLKWLGDGEISADLCFPLAVHKKWGAPHWGVRPASEANDWDVADINGSDSFARDNRDTFHITSVSSSPGSGMTADISFEKGIGIVSEERIHHGTIGEERTRLLRFEPASQH